ncbi:MAG: hypothetical protein JNN06_15420 [Gemmobacter sp.]|uniref:hypothetical protein n=1 Tax=Gemmobacter sp. TaxID=1898957 RepID=UPI001A3BC472|nr:hypothetical protein [Gemmobacter sp.]MBL8563660.1 hypothetical protein [Gemmobacter sp.]
MPQSPAIRLHLPRHMLNDPARRPAFYERLARGLQGLGARVEWQHRDAARLRRGAEGGHFDLVHASAIGRAQALTLGVAYLDRFQYLDPEGIFFESATARAPFHPATIPLEPAQRFLADLRAAYVTPRRSRHFQPEAVTRFAGGHIAVFLQDLSDPVLRARHMTAEQMLAAVLAHREGRAVVIKPHPRNPGPETGALLAGLRGLPGVTVTEANLHDILAGAAVSVSLSSSVGLEGMLHGVPAVFFGATDLHHNAVTVRAPQDWPQALAQALATDWPHAQFLLWFLRRRNIDARRPFMARVLERMAAAGGDLAALGLPVAPPEGFRV